MQPAIDTNGPVGTTEIEDLRQAVGWDRSEGTYTHTLPRLFLHYTARDAEQRLVGYLSVLSDGIGDAFLLDLMVHPQNQRTGLGSRIVRRAIREIGQAGVRCIQVTFADELESFYKRCGFHIVKAGIIDFNHMEWNEE